MKQLLLSVAAITALGLSTPARAQGVPTFDGSQLGQLVAQLEHMAMAAQHFAQIARDGAHIAALAADHVQFDMIGIGAVHEGEFLDPEGARGNLTKKMKAPVENEKDKEILTLKFVYL